MATATKRQYFKVFESDNLALLEQELNAFAAENVIVSVSHASRSTAFGSIYSVLVVYKG